MKLSGGRAETVVGLIDGPVAAAHPALADSNIRRLPGAGRGGCDRADSTACQHGTFVAGILCARRDSGAPAICPLCTLLVRPLFAETMTGLPRLPSATPGDLASALLECMREGARVINLSLALAQPSSAEQKELTAVLDEAARRGVLVVAAAGNQGTLGSTVITRHPWVIPVVATDIEGRPLRESNLGASIGTRGLRAPGDAITSLKAGGGTVAASGTSMAAPFVSGAAALLWSVFPGATAAAIKLALGQSGRGRNSVVPPLLDAWGAYQSLAATYAGR
ncbi:MAG TPA: S8 family serine peptidase [Pyrinomonadaceae bacterium]|nr:S8 family serine peptidase [Pyrinomonadaceae bacterium]